MTHSILARARSILVALTLALICLAPEAAQAADAPPRLEAATTTFLAHGAVLNEDSAQPPVADDPRWRPVELPTIFGPISTTIRGAWFRLPIALDALPATQQAIYLSRVHLNAGVYLNGVLVGDGGNFDDPMVRNWNYPLVFAVPQPLWRIGANEILVRVRTEPGFGGLAQVRVGAATPLRVEAEWQRFWQLDITAILASLLFGAGLFMLGLWWRRRHDTMYFWGAVAAFLWSVFALYMIVRNPIIPGLALWRISHASLDLWIAALGVFVHRFYGARCPRLERAMAVCGALSLCFMTMLPIDPAREASRVFHTVTLLWAVYLAVFAFQRWRSARTREYAVLAVSMAILVLAGVHDTVINLPFDALPRWIVVEGYRRSPFHIFHFTAPLVFLSLVWQLTRRFIHALDETEHLNDQLEARVEAGRLALEKSFEQRRALELRQAEGAERERVYRDLHDDVGAKLLSLALTAEKPAQADLARAALQDLRDVVSRSSEGAGPLSYALADWRAEMDSRLAAAGVRLDWAVAPGLRDPELSAAIALQLGRILREATSNVLRHAGADGVTVRVDEDAHVLVLRFTDNGRGFDAGAAAMSRGRGLRSIQARANQIGGAVHWSSSASGTELELRVPFQAFAAPPDQNTVVNAK